MAAANYKSNLTVIAVNVGRVAEARTMQAAMLIQKTTQQLLTGERSGPLRPVPGTGKYITTTTGNKRRIPGTGVYYRVSLPGQPPATRTGALRKSIRTLPGHSAKEAKVLVGTSIEYGPDLESERLNRYYLKPAALKVFTQVRDIFARPWKVL